MWISIAFPLNVLVFCLVLGVVQVFRVSSDVDLWFNLRPVWLIDSTTRPHLQVLLKHFEVPLIE